LTDADLKPGDVLERFDGSRFTVSKIDEGTAVGFFSDNPTDYEVTPGRLDAYHKIQPTSSSRAVPRQKLASWVKDSLAEGEKIDRVTLFKQAADAFGSKMSEGKWNAKDAFDALEAGINQYVMDHPERFDATAKRRQNARLSIDSIRQEILEKIPSQSGLRSEEQDEFQQFSTPPDLAYAMAWAANLTDKDTVLEPSAGIGGLAAFAKNAGSRVVVNELSPRRAGILKDMGFDEVYTENAEQINNILPKDVRPTVVLMNPPFSSTAGRVKGERKSANVVKHLDQALKLMQPGGRLVALVGKGWFADPKVVSDYFGKLKKGYNLRAIITVSGKSYAKYGTTYDNRILVIDKTAPDGKPTVEASVEDVRDTIPLLQEVRNARTAIAEQGQAEQEVQGLSGRPRGEPGPERPVLPATHGVGPGQREGVREGQQTENEPDAPHGEEARGRLPVSEAGGGRGVVSAGAGPRQGQRSGGVGGETDRRPGQQTQSLPSGLSPDEITSIEIEKSKDEEAPAADLTDSLYDPRKR
jgi:hypothetical protein